MFLSYKKNMLKFKTFKTIHNHDVQVKKINYNLRFIFQNINNVLFNGPFINFKIYLLNEMVKHKHI